MRRLILLFALCLPAMAQQTIVANTWTSPASGVGGFAAETPGYDGLQYIPGADLNSSITNTDHFCMFGHYHNQGSEPNYSVNCYSPAENRWDIFDAGLQYANAHFMEAGHTNGFWSYIPSGEPNMAKNILYYGSQSGSNVAELNFYTWAFDVGGRTGRTVSWTGTRIGNFKDVVASYDTTNHLLIAYGLSTGSPGGALTFNPATSVWTQQTDTGTIPSISGASVVFTATAFNSASGEMFLFGGSNGNSSCTTGYSVNPNMYAYNASTHVWRTITTTGPPGCIYCSLAYDPDDNVFMLTSGQTYTGGACVQLHDTWILSTTDNWATTATWTKVTPLYNFYINNNQTEYLSYWKLAYWPGHSTFVMVFGGAGSSQDVGNNQACATACPPFSGGTWTQFYARVYLYCLSGGTFSCPTIGNTTKTYNNPPVGSGSYATGTAFNRFLQGASSITVTNGVPQETWADTPDIQVSGATLYADWVESSAPFDASTCSSYRQPYAQAISSLTSGWTVFGSGCSSMATTTSRDREAAHIAYISGVPWAAWSDIPSGGNGTTDTDAWVKSYVSGAWGGTVQDITGFNSTTKHFMNVAQLTGVGTTPTLVVVQNNEDVAVAVRELYVAQWNGSAWAVMPGNFVSSTGHNANGKINVPPNNTNTRCTLQGNTNTTNACTTVEAARLGTDGTNIGIVWNQLSLAPLSGSSSTSAYTNIPQPGQLYAALWSSGVTDWINPSTGVAWATSDTPLNQNTSNWAQAGDAQYFGGNFYISWTERTATGVAQLYLKYWNGSAWTYIGPGGCNTSTGASCALNISTSAGYAFRPRLTNDGTSLYLGWEEQQAGSVNKLYVDKCTTSTCTALGSAINIDATNGSARNIALSVISGQPMALWQEVQLGQLAQVYGKQWNGSSWVGLFPAPANPNPASAPGMFGN